MKELLLTTLALLSGIFLLAASIVCGEPRFTDNGDGTV
jgi:hypothetical protein